MRLLIAGSRDLQITIDDVRGGVEAMNCHANVVITGMCRGPDMVGYQWAHECNITVWALPYVKGIGKRGGPYRNESMAKIADKALIFWDGKSPGTKNMIKLLLSNSVEPYIVRREG